MYRKQIDTLALDCRAVVAPMLQVQHLQDEMDRMRFTKEDLRNHANAVGADIPQEVAGCLALSARTFWTQHGSACLFCHFASQPVPCTRLRQCLRR